MLRLAPSTISSLASYRLVARWVLSDAIWRFNRRVLALGAFGGLGIFMQGSALGAALLYARRLETGDPVELLGRQLDPRTDVELLVVVALAITAALLLAGYLLYRFKSGAITLGREYESLRLEETLRAARRLPHPAVPDSAALLQEDHLFQVQRDARLCGRVLRKLVEGLVPLAIVPIAGVVLLVLNPALTGLLAAVTGLVAGSMFRINRRGARASERMERLGKDATRERKEAVREVVRDDVRSPTSEPASPVSETGTVRKHLDAYADRLQAIEDSGLASSLVTAVALGAILLLEGRSVLMGQSSLSGLLAYLVLLRIFLTNFMRLSRSITGVSRFYPQVKRHFTFAERTRPAASIPAPPTELSCVLRLPALHPEARDEHPQVDPGQRLALLVDGKLTRQSLASLAEALQPEDPRTPVAHVQLVDELAPPPGAPPWTTACGADAESLRAEAQEVVSPEALELFSAAGESSGETALTVADLAPVDAWTLGFLIAVHHHPHALVVPLDRWQELPPSRRRRLLDRARDCVLVFVTGPDSPPSDPPPDLVVFTGAEGVVGWSTPTELPSALETFRASTSRSAAPRRIPGEVDQVDDEEDG